MPAGVFGEDRPESAAAVRLEGVALPISGDDVGAVVGVTCPTNREGSGTANAIGRADLFALVSFGWADALSWRMGVEGAAGLATGMVGVNSTKGLCAVDMIVAGAGRRINR